MTHRTKHEASERETPTQHHTPEEMDALLQAAVDGMTNARAAIDACLQERLQWASDNTEAYNDAAGAAHLDARKAQDAMARLVDLLVLTFHPDRATAAGAYGATLEETVASLKFTSVVFLDALARHAPAPEGGAHRRRDAA